MRLGQSRRVRLDLAVLVSVLEEESLARAMLLPWQCSSQATTVRQERDGDEWTLCVICCDMC